MKVADEVWVSTALLHKENPKRADFAVEEIKARARQEKWHIRPGFGVHASYHCLANKPANPANHRMLFEDSRGRKRLFREGDQCHPDRQGGKIHPDTTDIPPQYKQLVDWYENAYAKKHAAADQSSATAQQYPLSDAPVPAEFAERLIVASVIVGAGGEIVIPMNIRSKLGIKEGTRISLQSHNNCLVLQPINEEFIDRLCGSYRGKTSLVEAWEHEHRIER
ncbi:MAG TPA: AbrB/MazE/SpoVT family DNA-binding domain-containing protein [Terriglobales bacterium]